MSFELAVARVQEIQSLLGAARPATPIAQPQVQAPAFARELGRAAPVASAASAGVTGSVSDRIVALARAEADKGVVEQPPGSNDSPDIARYRTATAGAVEGAPWCAYFTSYIAREAGAPIGDGGTGMGYVPAITTWAKQAGKFVAADQTPRPGDLVLFGGAGHIGIVESVTADGKLSTIEGNHSDRVDRVTRDRSEPVGYVRLG